MEDKARKRREAFKAEELHILLEEVEANKGLLFDTFKGAHTNKQKAKKWREIAERMTVVTGRNRSELETTLTGAGVNTAQPLNDEEEKAMAIIGFSASQGIPGGVDIHAGIQDPSGEQRQEAEEPIPHQSTSAAPTSSPVLTTLITALSTSAAAISSPIMTTLITAPSTSAAATSLPVVNTGFTAPSTSAAYTTPSTASTATASITAFNSCQCSQDLVELEREKVVLLKDVCGLLREAAERDKAFQEEVILLKRAKLDIAARRLALEEEKLDQPQLSIILPEHQVIQRYRLPREAIRQLLGTISQDLRRATRRSFALTPQVQLLAALRYYATGSFLQVVGDGLGLSKASVCSSVQAVTYSLFRLVPQHVRFPTIRDEMSATQEHFFWSFRIPQVVRAHVFICRKGYVAVNCQVVCDHQGIILDVVARWPGSTHDSFIFRESSIGRLAATSRGEWRLLGDSGYPLRPYLFTPVANPRDVHNEDFNEAHCVAREVEVALQMPPQVRRGATVLAREVVRCDLCDSNVA
ncbi:putative nuclease HARBI1 [Merluccius polli]|uniref:Nuclease HARBI1 n=1 Tax=Merluccius polli TaxID=89951 RepID=A0AA47NVI9_MERPO|nr:putative nuclease HARBI1 [Merluccius polli]